MDDRLSKLEERAFGPQGNHPQYKHDLRWTRAEYANPSGIVGAWVVIEKHGQEPPSDGNRVVVDAVIYLPAEADESLAMGLQWGEKCKIFGKPLTPDWGMVAEFAGRKMRSWGCDARADTWREALEGAHEMAYAELDRLKALLDERAKALVDAEVL